MFDSSVKSKPQMESVQVLLCHMESNILDLNKYHELAQTNMERSILFFPTSW